MPNARGLRQSVSVDRNLRGSGNPCTLGRMKTKDPDFHVPASLSWLEFRE
jgi:hypothetical protein